jgi:uncharacterized RDD family membrane protein YckC
MTDEADYGVVCPECGTTIAFGSDSCPGCGFAFSQPKASFARVPAAVADPAAVEVVPGLADFYARRRGVAKGEVVAAGFWIRVAAFLIDNLLLDFVAGISILLVKTITRPSTPASAIVALPLVVLVVLGLFLYEPLMTAGQARGTLGKQVVGVAITDLDGNRISLGRSFARCLLKIVPLFWLPIPFRADKRGLHDLIAGTLPQKTV